MARAAGPRDRDTVTLEIVFFDAGGTILDPHPSFAELFARVCRERGVAVSADDVVAVQERLAPRLVDLVEGDEAEPDRPRLRYTASQATKESKAFWTYLYGRFLGELGIEDEALGDALFDTFSDTASYRLYDDVIPAFETIAARGLRVGLISNFDGWLEKMLVEMQVGHVFDTSVISGVEGVEKPDPGIYRLALERARVEPDQAVHVGDSPALDVAPARAAGMHAVLLDRAGRAGGVYAPTISSLEELPPLLSKF